jgi:hypothetical protein
VTRAEELAETADLLQLYESAVEELSRRGKEITRLSADAEALAEALEECKHLIGRLVLRTEELLARYRGEKPQQAIADALKVVRAEQQRVAALPKTGGIAPDSWGHSWECQTGDGCVCGLTDFRDALARYRGEK